MAEIISWCWKEEEARDLSLILPDMLRKRSDIRATNEGHMCSLKQRCAWRNCAHMKENDHRILSFTVAIDIP